jgi:hypothetical protein
MLNIIFEIFKPTNQTTLEKIKTLIISFKYYKNLTKGISSGKIYHNLTEHNKDFTNFVNAFSQRDYEILDMLFKKDIEEFLAKTKLTNHLNFDKKIGLSQVGYNSVYVDHRHVGLWTTGKATFYIPTKKNLRNKILLDLLSIPPINVMMGFENQQMKLVRMKKLTNKKIEIILDPTQITKDISEIYINTDQLWLPGIILKMGETIKVGICIKSISVDYY